MVITEELKGDIKFCRELKEGKLSSEIWFDTFGRLIKQKSFSYYDNLISSEIKKSYENNNCTTYINKYKKGKLFEKDKFITDEFGNVTYRLVKNAEDKIVIEAHRVFNEKGKIKEVNTLIYLIKYDYDKYDNLLQSRKYDKENNLLETELYTYNSDGRKISYKYYNSKGLLIAYKYYIYNNNKIIKKIRLHNPSNVKQSPKIDYEKILEKFNEVLTHMDAFKYDINSKKIDIELNIDFLDSVTYYRYDSRGNLIYEGTYIYQPYFEENTLNDRYVNTYKYDENNQLIYKSEFEQMTERDLHEEYHYNPNDNQVEKEDKLYDKKGNVVFEKTSYSETLYEYEYYDGYKSQHLTTYKSNGGNSAKPKEKDKKNLWSKLKGLWS